MQNIKSIRDLQEAIRNLEIEQAAKGLLLKEQFHQTYESLKPVSFLKSTLKDITSSSFLFDNVLSTSIGIASGYLTKKIVIGTSANIFRRLLGTIMQIGVTSTVSQHQEAIKTFGQFIIQHILSKKETNSKLH
jgi:hypothetical protein